LITLCTQCHAGVHHNLNHISFLNSV
jgi:hypothetical protein